MRVRTGVPATRSTPAHSRSSSPTGWRSTEKEDYAFGIYDQEFGPKRLKSATHRREILFDKVRDEVTFRDAGESADGKEHEYTLLVQLDTTNVVVTADGRRERAEAVSGRTKPSMAEWFAGREYQVPTVRPATTVFVRAPRAKNHRFKTILRCVAQKLQISESE